MWENNLNLLYFLLDIANCWKQAIQQNISTRKNHWHTNHTPPPVLPVWTSVSYLNKAVELRKSVFWHTDNDGKFMAHANCSCFISSFKEWVSLLTNNGLNTTDTSGCHKSIWPQYNCSFCRLHFILHIDPSLSEKPTYVWNHSVLPNQVDWFSSICRHFSEAQMYQESQYGDHTNWNRYKMKSK